MDDETRLLELLERLRGLGWGEHPMRDVDLGPPQLAMIAQIARRPGCRMRELAAALHVTPPTVSVAVRQLEEKGLIERRSDPEDGRAVKLHLSRKGKSLHRRAESFRQSKARRLLAGLSPEDRRTLLDLLGRALDRAEEDLHGEGKET